MPSLFGPQNVRGLFGRVYRFINDPSLAKITIGLQVVCRNHHIIYTFYSQHFAPPLLRGLFTPLQLLSYSSSRLFCILLLSSLFTHNFFPSNFIFSKSLMCILTVYLKVVSIVLTILAGVEHSFSTFDSIGMSSSSLFAPLPSPLRHKN